MTSHTHHPLLHAPFLNSHEQNGTQRTPMLAGRRLGLPSLPMSFSISTPPSAMADDLGQ